MSRRPRLSIASRGRAYSMVVLFVLTMLLGTGNLLWTAHEVNAASAAAARARRADEQKWCALLETLTARPMPRARGEAYVFYIELTGLRRDFGC